MRLAHHFRDSWRGCVSALQLLTITGTVKSTDSFRLRKDWLYAPLKQQQQEDDIFQKTTDEWSVFACCWGYSHLGMKIEKLELKQLQCVRLWQVGRKKNYAFFPQYEITFMWLFQTMSIILLITPQVNLKRTQSYALKQRKLQIQGRRYSTSAFTRLRSIASYLYSCTYL